MISGRAHLPEPLVWHLEYGVGPDPIGWGLVTVPPAGQERDIDGMLGEIDTDLLVSEHGESDFTVRLAAYDPARPDQPVAVSNSVHIHVAAPTPAPSATVEPSPTLEPTPTPTSEPTVTPLPEATATPEVPVVEPTATPQASEPTATPDGEPQVLAAIVQPTDGAQVSGDVEVAGFADGPGFHSYVVEYAPAGENIPGTAWQPVERPQFEPSSATGGRLGVWATQDLERGNYVLRLTVYDTTGRSAVASVNVELVVAP